MKAMILAAGLGTRLRPITNDKPKALVKVGGMPLLEIAIRRLMFFGCREIMVNIHHFGDQIIRFLHDKDHFGIRISISDERDQLLETGGGLKKASWFFRDGQPFILCNSDILSNIDLLKMYEAHSKTDVLATLAVRNRESSRYLIFDDSNLLQGWTNVKSRDIRMSRPGTGHLKMMAFSGIHIIDPKLFNYFRESPEAFSIIDTYLDAAKAETILGHPDDDSIWLDVGRSDSLEKAGEVLAKISLAE